MKRCPAGEGCSIYKEVQMIYTFPHYYNHFKCTASGCPDTCCAGWGIMIDRASLKKYRDMDGPLAAGSIIPFIGRKVPLSSTMDGARF